MIGQGVTLVTGLPGSGKTALVVDMLSQIKNRPLFVMGIPDLKIEHNVCPPVEQWVEERTDPDDEKLKLPYFTFPPNAIIVLDEAQRVYRPRQAGSKVPNIVAAFETRRHTGVDFVLLTQHPTFVDTAIRKLTNRHIHIHCTTMGRFKLEWQGIGEPDSSASRDLAARTRYKPPKRVFDLYKSSELHTKPVVKRPWMVYAFVPLVLAVIGGIYFVKGRLDERTGVKAPEAKAITEKPVHVASSQSTQSQEKYVMTAAEYIEAQKPRIEGLMHSAPMYDAVTQPIEPPEPVGCIESKKTGCKCYTQQGTDYRTTEMVCREIMAKGIFMPWKSTRQQQYAETVPGQNKPFAAKPESAPFIGVIPEAQPAALSAAPKKS